MDLVEICNVCARKAIIEATKRIINSDKMCRNYSDLHFGVTVFGTQCMYDVAPSVSEEDELYEELVCETNLVYEAVGDELVEVKKYSRKPLRYSMLHSRKVHTSAHLSSALTA